MATPQVTSRILRRLLASGVTGRAERLLARMAPADVALLLPELTSEEIRAVVELLFRQRRAALALRELPHEMLPQVFDALADQRLAAVIGRLEIDVLGGELVLMTYRALYSHAMPFSPESLFHTIGDCVPEDGKTVEDCDRLLAQAHRLVEEGELHLPRRTGPAPVLSRGEDG